MCSSYERSSSQGSQKRTPTKYEILEKASGELVVNREDIRHGERSSFSLRPDKLARAGVNLFLSKEIAMLFTCQICSTDEHHGYVPLPPCKFSLACGHFYCSRCLDQWYHANPLSHSCPKCCQRTEFDTLACGDTEKEFWSPLDSRRVYLRLQLRCPNACDLHDFVSMAALQLHLPSCSKGLRRPSRVKKPLCSLSSRSTVQDRLSGIHDRIEVACTEAGEDLIDVAFALVNSVVRSKKDSAIVRRLWSAALSDKTVKADGDKMPAGRNLDDDAAHPEKTCRALLGPQVSLALKVRCGLSEKSMRSVRVHLRKHVGKAVLASEKLVQKESQKRSPATCAFQLCNQDGSICLENAPSAIAPNNLWQKSLSCSSGAEDDLASCR